MSYLPRRRRTTPAHARPGAATVEFALIAPLLGLLVVGMFELGRGLLVKQVLGDAARTGCRTASLPGNDNAAVAADVGAVLTANKVDAADATVVVRVNGAAADAGTAKAGDKIEVEVDVPVSKVLWTTAWIFKASATLSEAVAMVKQS